MTARGRLAGPFAAAVVGLLLGGCETFGPTGQQALEMEQRPAGTEASYSPFNWSPPNYAGMTAGRIIYPGATGGAPVVAEWLSGKEAETATVTFATPDGNVITYSAGGLRPSRANWPGPRSSASLPASLPISGRRSRRRSRPASSTPSASTSRKACAVRAGREGGTLPPAAGQLKLSATLTFGLRPPQGKARKSASSRAGDRWPSG